MSQLMRFSGAVKQDPAIDVWFREQSGQLAAIAQRWFDVMRGCGDDVRELLHDGHPTACVADAAFGYVNVFKAHVNVGFFRGAEIADPQRMLQGNGKFMRHVKLRPEHDVDAAGLTQLIETAYVDIKRRLKAGSQTDALSINDSVNEPGHMTKSGIRFKAKLLRPAHSENGESWAFLILPKQASAKLPSRGMAAVEGTFNGVPFQAVLEPDGQKSHWFKVDRKLSEAARARPGEVVTLEIAPAAKEPEAEVPADLRKALAAAAPNARKLWSEISAVARRDWIHWITSARQQETRARRIKNTCSMLAAGKRRVCCFDRSGFYSKALSAPQAAT